MDSYDKWLETIVSSDSTNGGGPYLAPTFYNILKRNHVKTLFEWCSGPAWIGIYLLEKGICSNLVLADINNTAINEACRTLKAKNLLHKCRLYISNNLDQIDKDEKFDVVVSNPPNYCNIREDHPHGHLRDDLRPYDKDWELHRDFYSKINKFLNRDARMYISEIAPYSKKIYQGHDTIPYDDRSIKPIDVFKDMINKCGLALNKVIQSNMHQDLLNPPILDENRNIIDKFYILDIS